MKRLFRIALFICLFSVPAFAGTDELRIVSTCPAVTEILYYLGAGDRIVGVSSLCDFPEEARGKERVADMTVDLEKILAQKPTLVVIMKGLRGGEGDLLRSLGLTVLELDLGNLAGLRAGVRELGDRLGCPERAAAFEARWEELRGKYVTPAPVRVYVETWGNPFMTVGGGSFITGLVELAGGVNVFGNRREDNFQVTAEEIIAADPELILLAYPEEPDRVVERSGFRTVAAVHEGRVFRINPDLVVRPGPRLLDGIGLINGFIRGGNGLPGE